MGCIWERLEAVAYSARGSSTVGVWRCVSGVIPIIGGVFVSMHETIRRVRETVQKP